jgi:hypothetical protein
VLRQALRQHCTDQPCQAASTAPVTAGTVTCRSPKGDIGAVAVRPWWYTLDGQDYDGYHSRRQGPSQCLADNDRDEQCCCQDGPGDVECREEYPEITQQELEIRFRQLFALRREGPNACPGTTYSPSTQARQAPATLTSKSPGSQVSLLRESWHGGYNPRRLLSLTV